MPNVSIICILKLNMLKSPLYCYSYYTGIRAIVKWLLSTFLSLLFFATSGLFFTSFQLTNQNSKAPNNNKALTE